MYNDSAAKFLAELKSGELSEESKKWQEDELYHGSEDWWYALSGGGYLSPYDIYTTEEAEKIKAAVDVIEEFFGDYGQFTHDETDWDDDDDL